nr:HlyD family efflux transporter periplasmic adaptor subunit [Burkholderia gladioli]
MIGEIVLVRPMSFTLLMFFSTCSAIALIAFFIWGSYTRRTTVYGVVAPDTGLVKVYAPQPGVVTRKMVVEGQHVARSTSLYTVTTDLRSAVNGQTQAALINQARERKSSLLQEIEKTRILQQDERETLRAKVASLRAGLTRIEAQLVDQRGRTSIAANGVARYRRLLEQDYVSVDQLQQRETDLLEQRSALLSFQRDRDNASQALNEAENTLSGLALKQENQLAQIRRAVIDVDQTLIESEARREFVVAAPEAGMVTAVLADPGQAVDTAHPVLSIVPDGAHWQVYLYVPSASVGFIHSGDSVRIRYQAYPYQKFGQYLGRVSSIASTALSAQDLRAGLDAGTGAGGGTFYRVTVALDAQSVVAYGKPQALRAGMTLQADILQERRRLYEWMFEPLYSLSGKF